MTPSQFDKFPPYDEEAEAAAIGSVMLADDPLQREMLSAITAAHFFVPQHAQIWRAISALAVRGDPIDAVTVRAELQTREQLEDVGGTFALAEVLKSVPSATNGLHYVSIVVEHARRRGLWRLARDISDQAYEKNSDPIELAFSLRDKLESLLRKSTTPAHRDGGSAEVSAEITAEAAGLRRSAPLPWPLTGRFTKCLLPGSITLLVGDPGAGKTFWLMQAMNHWTAVNTSAATLVLEKDRAWHLRRCLALMLCDMRLLDEEAIREYPGWFTSRPAEHGDTLDAIGRCIWDSSHCGSTLAEIAAWIDERADAGDRVIAIDPVSLANSEDKPWIVQDGFMRAARRSIQRTGASLILATHPKGGKKTGAPSIDDLSGSVAFTRRADSILWLRAFSLREARCKDGFAAEAVRTNYPCDRSVRIIKCRDGSAGGLDIGMRWNRTQGGFEECGIVEEWLDETVDDLPAGL